MQICYMIYFLTLSPNFSGSAEMLITKLIFSCSENSSSQEILDMR